MGGEKRNRIVEMTRFYGEQTDCELVNTMKIEVTRKRARIVVRSGTNPKRKESVVSNDPTVIGHQLSVSALMRKMAHQQ